MIIPSPVRVVAAALLAAFLFGLFVVAALAAAFALSGCKPESRRDPIPAAGRPLVEPLADARSKSSALFGTIGDAPEASAPVKRMAAVGERINGAATPQDYDWAKAIAASDKARDAALAKADALAKTVADLSAKLAAAPSPEELARAKERVDRVQAELDGFAFNVKCSVPVALIVAAGGVFMAWGTDRPKYAVYGFGSSLLVNLVPFVVKAVNESLALKIAIPVVLLGGLGYVAYEYFHDKAAASSVADAVKAEAGEALDAAGAAVAKSGLWTRLKAWFAKL